VFCQIKSDIDHRQKNRHGDFIESDIDHKEWQSTQLLFLKITLLGVLLNENHKSTPKIIKKLEIININKSYGDLQRKQSDHQNWKAAAIGIVKSNLYVSSETVKGDLKGHESLTWKSSGSKRFFSSLLGLWCGGFEGEKWRQLDFFYLFQISTLLSPLSLSSKEFII
jgi:hypothetical protein